MSLVIRRKFLESWRECVKRYGGKYGPVNDMLAQFDRDVAAGMPEDEAALGACIDWDVCDLTEDGKAEV